MMEQLFTAGRENGIEMRGQRWEGGERQGEGEEV